MGKSKTGVGMTAKEILNKRKFNPDEPIALSESEVEDLMNEFALHIAEQAVEEELSRKDTAYLYKSVSEEVGKNILSRIKKLTE